MGRWWVGFGGLSCEFQLMVEVRHHWGLWSASSWPAASRPAPPLRFAISLLLYFVSSFVFFFFFLVLVSNPCHAWKLNFVRVCGGRASDLVLVDYEFILNCILGCGGCGVVWWWLLVVGSCVGVVNYVWWVVNIILMCYIYYFNI